MKLPVVEGMWNGFGFLDRIYRIDGFLPPAARGFSTEGSSILAIQLILTNGFLKIRIHSSYILINLTGATASGWADT